MIVWKSQWINHRGHEVRVEKIDGDLLYGLCRFCKIALAVERDGFTGPAAREDCKHGNGSTQNAG